MINPQTNFSASLTDNKNYVRLQTGARSIDLSLSKAYALAHSMLKSKEYKAAAKILEAVLFDENNNAITAVMLACCKAGMRNFAECNALLHKVFSRENESTVDRLQAAIVYSTLGISIDAPQELDQIVEKHQDLPSLCLLIGDLLASEGHHRKAAFYWQMAVERDKNDGPVAAIAKVELSKLIATPQNNTFNQEQPAV
jgi:predicted Zn-dependent protease